MKNKILVTLMITCLTLAALTGCGSKNEVAENATGTVTVKEAVEETVNETVPTKEASDSTDPAVKFAGMEEINPNDMVGKDDLYYVINYFADGNDVTGYIAAYENDPIFDFDNYKGGFNAYNEFNVDSDSFNNMLNAYSDSLTLEEVDKTMTATTDTSLVLTVCYYPAFSVNELTPACVQSPDAATERIAAGDSIHVTKVISGDLFNIHTFNYTLYLCEYNGQIGLAIAENIDELFYE